MPKLPHKCAHYPEKGTGYSVCRCGDKVKIPPKPVKPPPTERAPVWKPVTWDGVRMAVKPFVGDDSLDATEAVIKYLLSCGVNVAPPF